MTTEEKARAYDKALERAKCEWVKNLDNAYKNYRERLEIIFPELKESESEMIRKALIRFHKSTINVDGIKGEDILAWLEKQRENDSQVILPLFTFDDILAIQCCMETVKKVQEDKDLYEKLKDLHGRVYDAYHLEKQSEQEVGGFDAELNALLKKYEHLSKKELQEPLEFYLGVVRDDLDVVREEEKPKWTEEDECYMGECISAVATKEGWSFEEKRKTKHWLESLKQRMEEQQ